MNKNKLALILIIVLAAIVRFSFLNRLSLFGDEIDIAYQAQSLALTGKDYFGNHLPLYFQSVSEWRLPGLVYLVALAQRLFGDNQLWVRLIPAIFGVINIYQVYRLGEKFKKGSGLWAALVLALVPWHLHFSRLGFDVTLQMFFLLLGLELSTSSKYRWLSLPTYSLSLYVYPTSIVFVPFMFLGYLLISRNVFSKKSLLTTALVLVPFVVTILNGQAGSRFNGLSIMNSQAIRNEVIEKRTRAWSDSTERFFTNWPLAVGSKFVNNYLSAFSTDFLFVHGDPNYRHSIGWGELFPVVAILILVSILTLKNQDATMSRLLLWWLAVSPIPASLTVDGASHATRLFVMLLPLSLLAGQGALTLVSKSRLIFAILVPVSLLISCLFYLHDFYFHYPKLSTAYYYYGHDQVLSNLKEIKYNDLFINDTKIPLLVPYAFYSQLDPNIFQEIVNSKTKVDNEFFSGSRYGNHLYAGRLKPEMLKEKQYYYAIQGDDIPGDWDWSQTPPLGLKVVDQARDVYGVPLINLVTHDSSK